MGTKHEYSGARSATVRGLIMLIQHANTIIVDGKTVATAGEDGSIGLWKEGTCNMYKNCHKEEALRLVFRGETLISGGADGMVKVWKDMVPLASSCIRKGDGDGQVYALISSDSEILVAHDSSMTVLDYESMTELLSWRYNTEGTASVGGPRNPTNEAFVFDACKVGEHGVLTALSDGTLRHRDVRSPLRDASLIHVHDNYATCCCWSSDEHLCVSGSGSGEVGLWDVRNWKCLKKQVVRKGPLYGASFFTKDASFLSWGNDGNMCIHDTVSGTHRFMKIMDEDYPIYSIDVHEDNIAAAGGVTPECDTNHSHNNVASGECDTNHSHDNIASGKCGTNHSHDNIASGECDTNHSHDNIASGKCDTNHSRDNQVPWVLLSNVTI